MQTSSISLAAAVAAVLTVASFDSASAGGWVVSGRPGFGPMHFVAPPFRPTPGAFGRFGQAGFFHHGPPGPFFAAGAPPFRRFGAASFQIPGRSGFFPFGGAQIVPVGIAGGYAPAPSPYVASMEEPPVRAVIWAPINVSVVAPAAGCADGESELAAPGGPKIIAVGPPAEAGNAENGPVIIYGTGSRRGC
jgi:hypothetical protein